MRGGLTPANVALLLGHKDTSALSNYERGKRLPTLSNAFRLSAILRVPVEFLFPGEYDELRNAIRVKEETLRQPTQPTLF